MGFINYIKNFFQKILDAVVRQYMKQFVVIMLQNFSKDDDNELRTTDVDIIRRKLFNLPLPTEDASLTRCGDGSLSSPGSCEEAQGSRSVHAQHPIRPCEIITDDYWNLFPDPVSST